jgi:hexokinase
VPAELTALINDTTGTLIASSYVNPRTRIAVIFGTGCNAAYMERVGEIHKIKNLGIDDDAQMAINCEWVGCSFVRTPDATILIPHSFPRAHSILSNTSTFQGRSTIR